ncbi:Golgi-associated plant pathogenesis-related protein 1-like [Anopheles darlingi]|uniref:Golgi-associated plant pathogenesis-related protein 1-like n=1 Tax=Anopheles darlingi TaxID=43151 RepID=UPI0020FFF821|nr:Golgi-associated plant pathogenesis-related protein 1-like [Anopheles darlingi]XP_049542065.1 Golgi-associated plant pathogenesis-related protein 1-like [Anopheles darlingi]
MSQTQEFRETVLTQHNKYREIHSAPPLELCGILCERAEKRANELTELDSMDHESTGENLFKCVESKLSGKKVVETWYEEKKLFNYDAPYDHDQHRRAGHFVQVIWNDSHRLGVGFATKDDTSYVVCYYDPSADEEKFHNNVNKPKAK